jgi:putative heme transporter
MSGSGDTPPAEKQAPKKAPPTWHRTLIKRVVVMGAAGIGLYVVWPSLAAVFSSGPQLRHVNPLWGIPLFAAELASFACMWALLRLALGVEDWFSIATAQLAGNAFSRIVPGGAAAGGAMQFDMLNQAGIRPARAATSVTAVSLISTATLLGLPVLSIPVILITGAPVERGLMRVGSIALMVCVAAIAGGALLLFADRPLEWVGAVAQRARNRLLPKRPPLDDLPSRFVDERDLIRRVLGAGWWKALLYSAGNWLLDLTALIIALAAVGAQPRASVVLLAYVVAAFLGMIPITPGGLGFVEAGLVATLGLAGIGTDQALLATLVYRLASYWLPIPMGAAAYLLAARKYGRPQHVESDARGEIPR